jgi:hypothetical protein
LHPGARAVNAAHDFFYGGAKLLEKSDASSPLN